MSCVINDRGAIICLLCAGGTQSVALSPSQVAQFAQASQFIGGQAVLASRMIGHGVGGVASALAQGGYGFVRAALQTSQQIASATIADTSASSATSPSTRPSVLPPRPQHLPLPPMDTPSTVPTTPTPNPSRPTDLPPIAETKVDLEDFKKQIKENADKMVEEKVAQIRTEKERQLKELKAHQEILELQNQVLTAERRAQAAGFSTPRSSRHSRGGNASALAEPGALEAAEGEEEVWKIRRRKGRWIRAFTMSWRTCA